jgi:hypothetical protein
MYLKGKDLKIKRIEELDSLENRGIEILVPEAIPNWHHKYKFLGSSYEGNRIDPRKDSFAKIKPIEFTI